MRGIKWWAKCVVHNCIIHPWLPAADAWDSLSRKIRGRDSWIAQRVYKIHDRTVPAGGG